MPDYGSLLADRTIADIQKQLRAIYKQAAKELKAKLASFTAKHNAKSLEKLALIEAGKLTKADYDSWMMGQVFIGNQWKDKIKQATEIMNHANEEAAAVIRKGELFVFAENYNHSAYELEQAAKGILGFNLYNTQSVAKLIMEKPKMLPEWKIDQPKDYIWNRQKVENSITQGIIQGEGIEDITKRLINNLCTTNENRMRLFARTGMTGAQNAGRQAQMEDAEEMGIEVKKRWVATLDDRTRDLHQDLDGQEVGVDEDFYVGDYSIAYPGDPDAEPEMVYNCRCTMIQIYPGIEHKSVRRAYDEPDETGHRESYTVEDMTYDEWKEWKEEHRR